MRAVVLALCVPLLGCEPSITDPCPGMRACPGGSCCPDGYTYLCGDRCYQQPCGTEQVTCINVDRTDGCYGGKWYGTLAGSNAPGGNVEFEIFEHVITAKSPFAGTGTIDCDSGAGSWSSTNSGTTYTFSGAWRHTDTEGDRISGATWTASGSGSGSGTWDALRVD